jgi:endoglucanase
MIRFLLLVLALLSASTLAFAADPLSPAEQVARMKRGVNIVGYDPLWQDASKARFKLRHFKIIKDGGFDSVRINLYGFRQLDEKMLLNPAWFATLDALVAGALAQKLHVVIDEHDYEACSKSVDNCRKYLLAFWSQVAPHFKDAPPQVTFELLNEPSGLMDDHWNALLVDALAVVRKTNPTRNVLIGPAFWNNIEALEKLQLPKNDRHIILSIHYYSPHEFTHQGAPWSPEYTRLSGIHWGTPADYARLERDFDQAQTWAKKHDLPVFLGEFGAYDKAPQDERPKYTAAVARAAENRGWAWGYWQFDSNFIVYDIDKDAWNTPIYEALIPPRSNP